MIGMHLKPFDHLETLIEYQTTKLKPKVMAVTDNDSGIYHLKTATNKERRSSMAEAGAKMMGGK
jgi:hypothetical protein